MARNVSYSRVIPVKGRVIGASSTPLDICLDRGADNGAGRGEQDAERKEARAPRPLARAARRRVRAPEIGCRRGASPRTRLATDAAEDVLLLRAADQEGAMLRIRAALGGHEDLEVQAIDN